MTPIRNIEVHQKKSRNQNEGTWHWTRTTSWAQSCQKKKEKSHDRCLSVEKKDRPVLSIVDEYKQCDSAIITMKERELQNKSILVLGDGGYYSSEPEAATNKVYKSRSTKDDTKSKKTEVAKGKKD